VFVEFLLIVVCFLTIPELRTRQTAEALGLSANIQPVLRECDYGRWAGKKFSEIVADEPDAANSWLRDPTATPHDGESILDLMRRVAAWLADETVRDQRSIAITHSTIIRATIVHAMDAPPQSFWRVDVGPLSVTRLSGLGPVEFGSRLHGRVSLVSDGTILSCGLIRSIRNISGSVVADACFFSLVGRQQISQQIFQSVETADMRILKDLIVGRAVALRPLRHTLA
jgi:broad specificity phosphatase PhoE